MQKITKNNTQKTIKGIIKDIQNKDLLIPRFQRKIRWNKREVQSLKSSLENNFPVGSLIFWKKPNTNKYYLLDGLQRTTAMQKIEIMKFNFIDSMRISEKYNKKESEIKKYFKAAAKIIEGKPDLSDTEILRLIQKSELFKNLTQEEYDIFSDIIQGVLVESDKISDVEIPIEIIACDEDIASDVFERLNIGGKKLSKLEISVAGWNSYRLEIQNNDYRKTIEAYYQYGDFQNVDEKENYKFTPIEIIYYIYRKVMDPIKKQKQKAAIFTEFFSIANNKQNWDSPNLESFAVYLSEKIGLENWRKDLGKNLYEKYNSENLIDKLIELVKEDFNIICESFKEANAWSNNKSKNNFRIQKNLVLFALFALINVKKEVISNNICTEVRKKVFSAQLQKQLKSKDAKGISAAAERINSENIDKHLRSLYKNQLLEIKAKKYSDIDEYICIFTNKAIRWDKDYEIDHLIPQSLSSNTLFKKINLQAFWNLQLIEKNQNKEKGNSFTMEDIKKYDLIYQNADPEMQKNMQAYWNNIIKKFNAKQNFEEDIEKFSNLRYNIIEKLVIDHLEGND